MTVKKTLCVVYEKGYEPAVQYVKALIETNDDKTDGQEKKLSVLKMVLSKFL